MGNYGCVRLNGHTKIYYLQKVDNELVNITSMILNQSSTDKCEEKFEFINRQSSAEVYRFKYQNDVYYAKKFITSTIERNISQLAKGPRGLRCYNMANILTSINIKVPESVFVLSYRENLLRSEDIYLTKEYKGISVFEFILKNTGKSNEKVAKVLLNLTSALGILYRNQFTHDDSHLKNFLVDPESLEICFIDLNTIRRHKKLSRNQIIESLVRLNSGIFGLLAQNGMGHLYTPERVQFYLENIFSYYQYPVDLRDAFSFLTRKTVQNLINRNKKSLITEDSFLLKI